MPLRELVARRVCVGIIKLFSCVPLLSPHGAQPASMGEDSASNIERYLANPPYFGRSGFADRERVKKLCGEGGERVFDGERKLWGTRNPDNLGRLITSRAWTPYGLDASCTGTLIRRARERREEQEAAKAAEAAAKEATKEAAKQAAAAKREAAAQAKREAATAAKQKAAKAIKTVVEDATVATPPAPASAAAPRGVEPTAHEVAECKRLGFTKEAIAYSDNLNELGPRGTLSNEGRLLRWCEVLTSDARYDVGEANRDDYFKSKVWLPVAEQAHLQYAKSLNERVAQAAWRD